jgi:hypothetical protein
MWPAPIHATASLMTDVPREYVWRALESATRWPEVLKDIAEAAIDPDGRLQAGAIMRSRAVPGTMAVDMAYRVIEAQAPERLVTESSASGFTARTAYRFMPAANGGTEITLSADVSADKKLTRLYVAAQRSKHVDMVRGSLLRRMNLMLVLAEAIWREQTGHPATAAGGARQQDPPKGGQAG